jgi:DNA-directed RNA polymerase beta' subunit
MQLRLVVLSDQQILAVSYGSITNPLSKPTNDWHLDRGSLFDPRIFGYGQDWECACGKYRGQQYEGLICDVCGTKIGIAEILQRERFGHINLALPVRHPLRSQRVVATIPVLPIAYRAPTTDGAELNLMYAALVRANEDVKQEVLESEKATSVLLEKLAKLCCNEWLDRPRSADGRPLRSLTKLLVQSTDVRGPALAVYLTALALGLAADND